MAPRPQRPRDDFVGVVNDLVRRVRDLELGVTGRRGGGAAAAAPAAIVTIDWYALNITSPYIKTTSGAVPSIGFLRQPAKPIALLSGKFRTALAGGRLIQGPFEMPSSIYQDAGDAPYQDRSAVLLGGPAVAEFDQSGNSVPPDSGTLTFFRSANASEFGANRLAANGGLDMVWNLDGIALRWA